MFVSCELLMIVFVFVVQQGQLCGRHCTHQRIQPSLRLFVHPLQLCRIIQCSRTCTAHWLKLLPKPLLQVSSILLLLYTDVD